MIFFEAERANPNGGIYHQTDKNLQFGHHLHNSFELIYVYKGCLNVTVEDRQFSAKAGEAVIVFPNQIHAIKSEGETESYLCVFENSLAGEFYRAIKGFEADNHAFKIADESLVSGLTEEQNKYKLKSRIYGIIGDFAEQCGSLYRKKYKSNEIIGKILNFVSVHYAENISMKNAAKEIGYDYHYLSNLLQKTLNTTFRSVLNEYRISCARYLLVSKENKIYGVAKECGFNSLCSFNRNFKSFTGVTPEDFRKKEITERQKNLK